MDEIEQEKASKNQLRDQILPILTKMVWGHQLNNTERLIRVAWISAFGVSLDVLKYYTDKRVLFFMVNHLGNKELCFDSNIRWLYAAKIDSLIYNMWFYKIFEDPKTFYCGLVHFSRRERPPFSPIEKKEWSKKWIGSDDCEFNKVITGYNFGIDLDSETFEEGYEDAKKIVKLFRKFNIKYSVWFSGKRGMHFVIDFNEFKDLINPFSVQNCVDFCHALALDIKDKLKLKHLDSVIYSQTRFLKLPMSLDSRNLRPILPLSDYEFDTFLKNFNLYTTMNYVLNQENLGYMDAYRGRKSNPSGFKQLLEAL